MTYRVQSELELGIAKREQGDLAGALETLEAAFEAAQAGGDADLQIAATRELGLTLLAASRLLEADALLERVLQATAERHGKESPQWAAAAEELALARRARGDIASAVSLQLDAFETSRRALGEGDPVTRLIAMNLTSTRTLNRALMLSTLAFLRTDSPLEVVKLPRFFARLTLEDPEHAGRGELEASLEKVRSIWNPNSAMYERGSFAYRTFSTRIDSLASQVLVSSHDRGNLDQGYDLARRLLARQRAELGDAHPQTLNSLQLLARATVPRDAHRAVALHREAALASTSVLGRGHVDTLGAYEDLAGVLAVTGAEREAGELRAENVRIRAADEGIIGELQPPIENLAGTLTEPVELVVGGASAPSPREISPGTAERIAFGNIAADRFTVEPLDDEIVAGALADTHASPIREPGAELVRRTAHAELNPAGPIGAGELFEVEVYVDCAAPDGPGTGELRLRRLPGKTELPLVAWLVVSRHFEIEGKAVQSLLLDLRETETPHLHFQVRAVHVQEFADEDPEVRVLFSYEGWPSGEARLPVPLAETATEGAP